MFRILNILILSLCLLSAVNISHAQTVRGTGDNFGSGWRSDGNGNLVGTGKIMGQVGGRMVMVALKEQEANLVLAGNQNSNFKSD